MPKPVSSQPVATEKVRTTIFRVVPHVGRDGKPVPEKWDTEELVINGTVEARMVHERAQSLPVARERHSVLMQKYISREAPETWK